MKVLLVMSVLVCCVWCNTVQENTESKRYYKPGGRRCITPEGAVANGQHVRIRQNPCMEYKCEDGYLQLVKSGCPNDGRCHRIGESWQARDCHTYICRQIGQNSVEIQRTQSGCRDANRQCRRPGEHFPYEKNGLISWGCTCWSTPGFIHYECPPQ